MSGLPGETRSTGTPQGNAPPAQIGYVGRASVSPEETLSRVVQSVVEITTLPLLPSNSHRIRRAMSAG